MKSPKDPSDTSISSQNWKHCLCHQPNSQCFQTLDNNNNNSNKALGTMPANRPNRSHRAWCRNPASPSEPPSWQAPPPTLDGTDLMAEAIEGTTSLLHFQKLGLGSSFGCWCHFLLLRFSSVLFVTWEEVCTSHEYLPVDKAKCIHIYLFQSRFTVPQVHCSFKHFWGHIADRTNLKKHQTKASHQEVISKFNTNLLWLVFSTVKKTQLIPNPCPQLLDSYQSSHNKRLPPLLVCMYENKIILSLT